MTERQFNTWQRWLSDQWDLPDRGDYYAMQIAAAVKDVSTAFSKHRRRSADPNKLRLAFTHRGSRPALTEAEAEVRSKIAWAVPLGGVRRPGTEEQRALGRQRIAEARARSLRRLRGDYTDEDFTQ